MDVVLLGVVVPGVENPALATLGAALDRAGLAYDVVPFGGAGELERMLAAVERAQPRVCALSLQTAAATGGALAFTRALRARGFAGQIIAGGHAATLAADDLLASDTGIDVVIELAGEDALVGLARGEPALELPGTRTRTGRGKRAVPIAPRAFPHPRLGEHLGFATADLVLSRGCEAQCEYCTVAAISALAQHAGAPRHERRATGAIADEIAELVERGARAFHILDDNLLPLEPDAGVAWARALQAALRTRKVPAIALALDLRADAVTPALADALADLGLVRARVGIDGYTPPQLRALGRTAGPAAAVPLLTERGILCVATTLLVGPTIRFATLLDEVDALAAARFAPIDLRDVEPRPGTPYHDRVRAHGLIGRFADPRTALVAQVLAGLPTRTSGRTVAVALDDLAWALGVTQRLAPAVNVDGARAAFSNVGAAWNADLVRVLRLAIAAADTGEHLDIAREVTAHDEGLLGLVDTALAEIALGMSKLHGRPVRAHQRAALLAQSAAGTQ